jgi:uncharacterized protein YPO0396
MRMKLLRKLLIINWHYIDHELLELENVNFLTGKNASGKSTIIDAIQLLFLGDTNEHYFNKAANERSRRTLKGYLRCEVGDDGETGSRYQRTGDFSSYIVAEFTDTNKRQPLTVGIVFDSYSDDKHDHRFFIMNNASIPQNHFLRNNVPMSIRDLQAWCKTNNTRAVFYETNKRYREEFLGQMGGLREKFFKLFRKAVPFTPTNDIEEFISEFVCDITSEVNITEMQQNIRIYRDLEYQAERVRENITSLRNIEDAWQKWDLENARLLEQEFLYDRAEEQRLLDNLDRTREELKKLQDNLTKLAKEEEDLTQVQKEKQSRAKELQGEIERSDIRQKEQNLTQKINQLQQELRDCANRKDRLHNKLSGHIANWAELANWAVKLLPETLTTANELQAIISACQALLDKQDYPSIINNLPQAETLAQDLANQLADKRRELKQQLDALDEKHQALKEKIHRLEQGIKSFDPRLERLRDLIQAKVPGSNPRVFCDLLEISDEQWQNAIEGYLHTQKFYLLVEPEAFVPALQVYDREKQNYNLHSFGLVDVEKLIARDIKTRPGSLAEYITTGDPHARALAGYLLGRVIGCAQVEEIRNHEVAITPGCMLYQNYAARQLDPARYRDPFIGKQAIRKQIENARADLVKLEQEIGQLNEELARFKALPPFSSALTALDHYIEDADHAAKIPTLETELKAVEAERDALDLTWLDRQQEKVNVLEREVEDLQRRIKEINRKTGATGQAISSAQDQIPALENKAGEQRRQIEEKYEQDWLQATGEPRFRQELDRLKTSEAIKNNFHSQVARTRNQADKSFSDLRKLRDDYNRINHMSLDPDAKNNTAFANELAKLEETYLREYEGKIKESRQRAERQFREDFISKLRNNIESAQQQLDEINKTLKNIPFGQERYRFKVLPSAGKRKFYDMIMDDLLLQGNDLFSGTFQEKHKEALEDLFRRIVPEDNLFNADSRSELEKNLEEFTDYRKYLEFDLISTDDEGNETRLSKMLSKRSGGETQNPFYIAVLASFAHIYRTRMQGYNETMRLIVFDEAFNKMDHQRIQESIKLARKLGLQLVISAPTEKVADIAPLVDRTLCVVRIKSQTSVRHFDPTREEEL